MKRYICKIDVAIPLDNSDEVNDGIYFYPSPYRVVIELPDNLSISDLSEGKFVILNVFDLGTESRYFHPGNEGKTHQSFVISRIEDYTNDDDARNDYEGSDTEFVAFSELLALAPKNRGGKMPGSGRKPLSGKKGEWSKRFTVRLLPDDLSYVKTFAPGEDGDQAAVSTGMRNMIREMRKLKA